MEGCFWDTVCSQLSKKQTLQNQRQNGRNWSLRAADTMTPRQASKWKWFSIKLSHRVTTAYLLVLWQTNQHIQEGTNLTKAPANFMVGLFLLKASNTAITKHQIWFYQHVKKCSNRALQCYKKSLTALRGLTERRKEKKEKTQDVGRMSNKYSSWKQHKIANLNLNANLKVQLAERAVAYVSLYYYTS